MGFWAKFTGIDFSKDAERFKKAVDESIRKTREESQSGKLNLVKSFEVIGERVFPRLAGKKVFKCSVSTLFVGLFYIVLCFLIFMWACVSVVNDFSKINKKGWIIEKNKDKDSMSDSQKQKK